MPLPDYLNGLDMESLPDTLIEDILREASEDAAPHLAEVERLNVAFADADGRANTSAAELADLKAKYDAVAAHNYELMMNGGEVPDEVTIEGDDEESLTGDDVLDQFFTDVDN